MTEFMAGIGVPQREEGKDFFFEKKKQKTFILF
jgi:hypothetical protein